MMFKKFIMAIGLVIFASASFASVEQKAPSMESDQQIGDFSLSGYGEKGKKTWDLAGKSADIFTDVVKLKDVVGNLYGKDEDIKLTADTGDFNKTDGKVHLEQNVVITTSSGTRLNTDVLDWDRKKQLVSTKDTVNIKRDNMTIVATGAQGQPNLKKVALEKDVKLDINPTEKEQAKEQGAREKITITCDGPLEIDYEKSLATFSKNVKVERQDSVMYADRMDAYFIASDKKREAGSEVSQGSMSNKIDKIIARGNVRVVRGENTSYSQEAIYSASDKKLTLTGRPKLVIYSTEELGETPAGN